MRFAAFWIRGLLLVCGASAPLLSCGGDSGNPPVQCGSEVCGLHQECNQSTLRCDCVDGYAGDDCDQCASGYEAKQPGVCTPIPIDCSEDPCGTTGVCVTTNGVSECVCNTGYGGPTCAQCADEFQDNDMDGECTASCSPSACDAPKSCEDATGTIICKCPPGSTGPNCELCESGHARVGDGLCYELCDNTVCDAPRQFCFDDQRRAPAECRCEVGYTGSDCSGCDTGFAAGAGGTCVPIPKPTHTLITGGSVNNKSALVSINPQTGEAFALRTISVGGLAFDPASKALYDTDGAGVDRLDLATGSKTPVVSSLSIGHGTPLTFHTGVGALFTLAGASPYALHRIDPAQQTDTEVGPTGLSWVFNLAYDPTSQALYALRDFGGMSIHRVDPSSGAESSVGTISGLTRITSGPGVGFSIDPAGGKAYVMGSKASTQDEIILARCRQAAVRLGYSGYDAAPATLENVYNGSTGVTTLTSSHTSEELVVYRSYTGSGGTVRVATDNAKAFVCVLSYEEDFTLEVAASAKLAAGVLYDPNGSVVVSVDPGFVPGASPPFHAAPSQMPDPSLIGATSVFRLYSNDEWNDRVMPPLSGFEDSNYSDHPRVLVEYAFPALTKTREVSLPTWVNGETLAPFSQ